RLGRLDVPQLYPDTTGFQIGQARVLRIGTDVTIVACGIEVNLALDAAEKLSTKGIDCEVIDAFSIKPLDHDTIINSAKKTGRVITAEEHSIIGGLGSAVAELLAEAAGLSTEFKRLGVMDCFGTSGAYDELFRAYQLDSEAIQAAVVEFYM
ncbi:MAG: transketolase family protein, partial [Coriobacteriales bacterium]|nr:transketolase family protein [Coriobacteriales bacterium]